MGKFGFEAKDTSDAGPAPEGYLTATVNLGEHSETLAFWPKIWSPADYAQNWLEAAEGLLAGEAPVLFCTDYATISCSCFVGWPENDGFVFEEWLIKHEDLARRGVRLLYMGEADRPNPRASHFHVPSDDVEAFVRSRS